MGVEFVFYAMVLAYAAATILFFRYLAGGSGAPPKSLSGPQSNVASQGGPSSSPKSQIAPSVLTVAVLLHATYIGLASVIANICPVKSIHFVASIAALLAAGIYLVMRTRSNIDALGAFVAPVALTFVLGSRFVGVADQGIGGGLLALHVTVNVLGDAFFVLASGTAVLYLVEERRLKQRRASSLFGKLPPLDALDRAEHRFLLVGFPLLTLGILTGTLWAHRLTTGSPAEVARALFAFTTWVLFAGVLLLRAVLGWRGRRAAYGTIAGFLFAVAVLVVYFVRGPLGGVGGAT